eukprot:snap_masked-scaffold_44-processed-gene-1.79-mRNA-1 protein AED:1.00 eAED:1.00 QI:0/0/0/0/1/1/3/0/346
MNVGRGQVIPNNGEEGLPILQQPGDIKKEKTKEYNGFFCGMMNQPAPKNSRLATKEENYEIDYARIRFKQLMTCIFCGICVIFTHLKRDAIRIERGEDVYITALPFICDIDSDRSIVLIDNVTDVYSDQGGLYCYFKSCMVILSMVMLFPLFLRSLRQTTIMIISYLEKDVKIPISNGQYSGTGKSSSIFHNPYLGTFGNISIISEVYGLWNSLSSKNMKGLRLIWALIYLGFPDIILNILLFVVSYFVMISTRTLEDIVVKLVAVHVFARLDETLVKYSYRPRSLIGDSILNYVKPNPNSTVATYEPIKAFELSLDRHEMGVKLPREQEIVMNNFHEYEGFPLAP